MEFTSNMLAVMKAIWSLRVASGQKELSHTKVAELSASFTIDKEPVARQNWYNSGKSRPEWQYIKKAIDGVLPASHPIERKIASFNPDGKTSAFVVRIADMEKAIGKLKVDLEDQRAMHEDFVKRCRHEQYEESHFKVNFHQWKTQAENLQKESENDRKSIKALLTEVQSLRTENDKYKKLVTLKNANERPQYQLFYPDNTKISDDLSDKDLLTAYESARDRAMEKMIAVMAKKPPLDIFLIFYSLNVDIDLVVQGLPFKFSENNYVFACFATGFIRRNIYDTMSKRLELISPSVILIDPKSKTPDKPSNVYELPEIKQSRSAMDRLRSYIAQLRIPPYDVVQEGYENVTVRR